MTTHTCDLTVVVSTYNRADRLPLALDALRDQSGDVRYEIIVVDNNSTDSTRAVVEAIAAESGGKVPALALSAFATAESRKRALESGFNSYATKPFEPDLLIKEIVEIVGRRTMRPS